MSNPYRGHEEINEAFLGHAAEAPKSSWSEAFSNLNLLEVEFSVGVYSQYMEYPAW